MRFRKETVKTKFYTALDSIQLKTSEIRIKFVSILEMTLKC